MDRWMGRWMGGYRDFRFLKTVVFFVHTSEGKKKHWWVLGGLEQFFLKL
jgi:hypothetical protein